MKVLALLTALIASTSAQTANENKDHVRSLLRATHQSAKFNGQVKKNPFSPGSYQLVAREQTATRYGLTGPPPSDEVIENYYALACIYESTNGKPNPRIVFDDIEPWKDSTGWGGADGLLDDYCSWFGITCQNGLVQSIKLNNNTLHGIWPSEVAFLGETLESIDLFFNYFNFCGDYEWFQSMKVLNFLYFGSTSWDSNGIPSVLKFLTSLFELDISNTYWRGYLNPDAFTGSPDLYYVDMGNNFYSLLDLETVPETLFSKNIIRLFMDNIKITDNQKLTLDFVGEMPIILEFWADFTKFDSDIPSSIGNAETLKSLSLTYCGLTGPIPVSLAATDIERMWLYANKLTGTFPTVLASKDWRFLFIEENDLTGSLPAGICSQVGTADDALQGLGADCMVCKGVSGNDPTGGDCCTCCGGEGCGNLEESTPGPTPTPSFGFCFSGDSEVDVENSGPVKMADLAIGDAVKVADNKFEPVYSFGHKSAAASAEFLHIATEGNRKALEISKDHMVVIEGGRNVPASTIKIGDKLVSSSGELVAVKSVQTVVRKGVYAPFTASGSIIVNDVVASNYIAYQGSEYLKISGIETPLSFQWLAHIFNSVHRVAYMMGITGETYTEDGVSQWVNLPNKAGTWLLEQNFVIALCLLLPSVAFFGFVSIIEALLNSPITVATAVVGVVSVMAARRTVSVKMTANKV